MMSQKAIETDNFNYGRIASAIQFISENVKSQPSLDEIAACVHMSPFHFQRMFTEWAGVSPKKFLQFLTTQYLKSKIQQNSSLLTIAEETGLSGQSRIYDLFTGIEAMTPLEYKMKGKDMKISYGFHSTPFGWCIIAVTERGICHMAFTDNLSEETEFSGLKDKWPESELEYNQEITSGYIERIFKPHSHIPGKLHLLVKGTNFQVNVWKALLTIPPGSLSTYKAIAESIGNSGASRAVGSAIGANPIAYLIPCHRVIRSEGVTGGYHWGSTRKKAILGWEAAKIL